MKFAKDSYETPDNKRRCLLDILSFKTRWYFYLCYLHIIYKTNRVVKSGTYEDPDYCHTSDNTFKLIESCGGKFHIKGLDNIKNCEGSVVFIGNHMSILETFILPGLIIPFKSVSFIVKESLVKSAFFGAVMSATHPISVTRKDPKKDYKSVMVGGKKFLDSGRSIIVFPQSTRGSNFISAEFGSIGDKLAQKANVQVIPVALKTDFWSNGKILKDFGRIHRDRNIYFEFGKPLSPEIPVKEKHSMIVSFIEDRLKTWSTS